MIDQACKSLNKFLHDNVEHITRVEERWGKPDTSITYKITTLRKAWVDLNPEFKEFDLDLDIVWEGLSGRSNLLWEWCGNCGECYMCCDVVELPNGKCMSVYRGIAKGPHAKSFKVVIRNWDEEITIHNKIDVHMNKMSLMQRELKGAK